MRYLAKKHQKDVLTSGPQSSLTSNIEENLALIRSLYKDCSDLVVREFEFGSDHLIKGAVIFFDGLISKQQIEHALLYPLVTELRLEESVDDYFRSKNLPSRIKNRLLAIAEIKEVAELGKACHHLNSGDTLIMLDSSPMVLAAGTRGWSGRGIDSPPNEGVVRGPKEAFCETLRLNTALIRRRIKSPSLKIVSMPCGKLTQTDVAIAYIDGLVRPEVLKGILDKIKSIDLAGILDTGYLEEYLEENNHTLFSQVENTERPDRVCGNLLEGRVAILVEGSPTALILPTTFSMFWTAAEDYYMRYLPASIFRTLRFIAFLISMTVTAFYVAVITFHHEMIPTSLYFTIAASREAVPFPAIFEALIMDITFEILQEAGLRLPRIIGPAISIVGALVIGDAAVQSGLVSTPMVVMVAFAGICSFVMPSYNAVLVVRIARFMLMVLAGFLGFFGIILGLILLLINAASLESYGIPFMQPLGPVKIREWSDTWFRRSWKAVSGEVNPASDSNAPSLLSRGGESS